MAWDRTRPNFPNTSSASMCCFLMTSFLLLASVLAMCQLDIPLLVLCGLMIPMPPHPAPHHPKSPGHCCLCISIWTLAVMQPGCSGVTSDGSAGSCPRLLQVVSLPCCCSHVSTNAGNTCGCQSMHPSPRWVERWGDRMTVQALRGRAQAEMR